MQVQYVEKLPRALELARTSQKPRTATEQVRRGEVKQANTGIKKQVSETYHCNAWNATRVAKLLQINAFDSARIVVFSAMDSLVAKWALKITKSNNEWSLRTKLYL